MIIIFQPDKPFKDYPELIDTLKKRGLEFDDENYAIAYLKGISYYTIINGYKSAFINTESSEELFIPGTNFNSLVFYYQIDTNLQNLLFKYILVFERSYKTKISYVISKKYGVKTSQYLDRQNFQNRSGKTLSKLKTIRKIVNTKYKPTKHYKETKNHVPFWILSNNLTLGQVNMFYSILKFEDKKQIVQDLLDKTIIKTDEEIIKNTVRDMTKLIQEYRNRIAHATPLIGFKSDVFLNKKGLDVIIPDLVLSNKMYKNKNIGKRDCFALLLSLFSLIDNTLERQSILYELRIWESRFSGEYNLYASYLKSLNLPNDFIKRLELF